MHVWKYPRENTHHHFGHQEQSRYSHWRCWNSLEYQSKRLFGQRKTSQCTDSSCEFPGKSCNNCNCDLLSYKRGWRGHTWGPLYDNLRRAIDSIPAQNMLLVIRDFHARVWPKDARFPFHESVNRNGKYLVDFAIEKNLLIANTYFQKRIGKRWAYISPGGTKCQLDYTRAKEVEEKSSQRRGIKHLRWRRIRP